MAEEMQMKVIDLLDEFENTLENAKAVPLSGGLIFLKKDEIISLIEEMNIYLPEEYQKVRWIKSQEENILSEAREEADKLVSDAKMAENNILTEVRIQEKQIMDNANAESKRMIEDAENTAAHLVSESAVLEEARRQADMLLDEARTTGNQIVANSLKHVREMLLSVRQSMSHMLDTVDKNINELDNMNNR